MVLHYQTNVLFDSSMPRFSEMSHAVKSRPDCLVFVQIQVRERKNASEYCETYYRSNINT